MFHLLKSLAQAAHQMLQCMWTRRPCTDGSACQASCIDHEGCCCCAGITLVSTACQQLPKQLAATVQSFSQYVLGTMLAAKPALPLAKPGDVNAAVQLVSHGIKV